MITQPHSVQDYRDLALKRLHRKIKMTKRCNEEREKDPTFALELPYEIGLKLSNRCDLRCTHCFQWNEEGYHKHLDKPEVKQVGDMDIELIRDIFERTKENKSLIYLWGGEPMIYSHWNELIDLLENDPRETVVCTNGMSIKRKLDSILRVSESLIILISVEGLQEAHDKIRGKNTFNKIINNVELLLDLQKQGVYKGYVSIASVLSDELIPQLYDFCDYFNNKEGIETLYINYPWYIPKEVAEYMDNLFKENYSWMGTDKGLKNTWHSFGFKLNPLLIETLFEQIMMIRNRKWNIRIRFQPGLDDGDVKGYIEGDSKPGQNRTRCLGISNRIDLLPNGTVTPCKKFTEFVVGDLSKNTLEEVWHGEEFRKFREIHNNELMPICSKCEILYANGA